jgi:hypothetical protein
VDFSSELSAELGMEPIPPFTSEHLTAICKVLGDTEKGLNGSEISQLLTDCRIPDPDPAQTKWKRLFNAFAGWQNSKQLGNCVLMFITRAMNPALYTKNGEVFASRRDELNVILAFSGMHKLQALPQDGKPISSWNERDAAFLSVAEGIRSAVESINAVAQSKRA